MCSWYTYVTGAERARSRKRWSQGGQSEMMARCLCVCEKVRVCVCVCVKILFIAREVAVGKSKSDHAC